MQHDLKYINKKKVLTQTGKINESMS